MCRHASTKLLVYNSNPRTLRIETKTVEIKSQKIEKKFQKD